MKTDANKTGIEFEPRSGSLDAVVGMRYWHEIPAEEQREIMKSSGITWGEFLKRYRQPDWCSYPDALGGPMGCWSLLTVVKIKAAENCKGCDECTAKHPNDKVSDGCRPRAHDGTQNV